MNKKFLFLIVAIAALFAASEIISFNYIKKQDGGYVDSVNVEAKEQNLPKLSYHYGFVKPFDPKQYAGMERKVLDGDKNKPSILFFGGSNTYGDGLPDEETLPYFVNKKTNKTAVNKGFPGGCITNSLLTLTDEKFYKPYQNKKITAPDYIVISYNSEFQRRMAFLYKVLFLSDNFAYEIMPQFDYKDGKLTVKRFSKFLYPFLITYTAKAISLHNALNFYATPASDEKMYELLCAVKDTAAQKFDGFKNVVIISYKDASDVEMSEDLKQKLEENGFMVFDAETLAGHELTSDKWIVKTGNIPNKESNADVAKGLVKKLR